MPPRTLGWCARSGARRRASCAVLRRVRGMARHVAVVSARDHWRWEMAGISEAAHRGVAIGADDEMRDGGMRDREAQPSLWRQLQGSAHDVSYHVRVADDDLGSVTHLGGRQSEDHQHAIKRIIRMHSSSRPTWEGGGREHSCRYARSMRSPSS